MAYRAVAQAALQLPAQQHPAAMPWPAPNLLLAIRGSFARQQPVLLPDQLARQQLLDIHQLVSAPGVALKMCMCAVCCFVCSADTLSSRCLSAIRKGGAAEVASAATALGEPWLDEPAARHADDVLQHVPESTPSVLEALARQCMGVLLPCTFVHRRACSLLGPCLPVLVPAWYEQGATCVAWFWVMC